MNKSDVYKLIGYHGEYNSNVKKAIRKLLKENHPDNKGDRKKFELIQEVKKELENGEVSYVDKKSFKNNKEIDVNYCNSMINELKIKKINFNDLMNSKRKLLDNYEDEYKNLYQKSLDLENKLLINTSSIKKVNNIKLTSIIVLVLMIIVFILSIIKDSNTLFIIFIVLSIICVIVVQKHLLFAHKVTENNKRSFTNYIKANNDIKKNIKKQAILKKEIRDIKRKLVNVENDLRFYKNLLK